MASEQVNLRLGSEIVEELQRLADAASLDRATYIRRLLEEAVSRERVGRALEAYARGEWSAGRAAEESGLSIWDVLDRSTGAPADDDAASLPDRLAATLGEEHAAVVGHQQTTPWLGKEVLSLADLPPRRGGVVIVGINPTSASVRAGHYFQGSLGQRLWKHLKRVDLLREAVPGAEDDAFVAEGNGLTDVVKRPTNQAGDLTLADFEHGRPRALERLETWQPGLVVFPFKRAAAVLHGRSDLQTGEGPPLHGTPTFLLARPYAPRPDVEANEIALRRVLARLEIAASGA